MLSLSGTFYMCVLVPPLYL